MKIFQGNNLRFIENVLLSSNHVNEISPDEFFAINTKLPMYQRFLSPNFVSNAKNYNKMVFVYSAITS